MIREQFWRGNALASDNQLSKTAAGAIQHIPPGMHFISRSRLPLETANVDFWAGGEPRSRQREFTSSAAGSALAYLPPREAKDDLERSGNRKRCL